MNEIEIIGFARLVSLTAIIVAGFCYFYKNQLGGRIAIAIAVLSIGLSVFYSEGFLLSIVSIVVFLCLPFILAPVYYILQRLVLWKVEQRYGPDSTGVALTINWFGGYRVL